MNDCVMDPSQKVSNTLQSKNISYELTPESISMLALGKIRCILVLNYYPKSICLKVADSIFLNEEHGNYNSDGHYADVADVGRLGQSYFEVCKNADLINQYFKNARMYTKHIRKLFHPYYAPIDRLRLELEEMWPSGAILETLRGRKMFVGLCRSVVPGKRFLPHTDWFYKDADNSMEASSLISQMAANVYLKTSETGGELKLWNMDLTEEEYLALKIPDSYGLDPMKMPPPDVILHPSIGDLVLFNAMQPHAVDAPKESFRLSQSCFVGYRGEHVPLTYWS